MRIMWGMDASFVGQRLPGGQRGFGNCRVMEVHDKGMQIAAIVFHNYNPEAGVIEISGASETERWLTRPVLWAMFHYPFDIARCQCVVMRVAEDNETFCGRGVKRMLRAYGFSEFVIPNLRGRGKAEIIFTLTDEAWRENGFHRHAHAMTRAAA